jgi:hypothetical protein
LFGVAVLGAPAACARVLHEVVVNATTSKRIKTLKRGASAGENLE